MEITETIKPVKFYQWVCPGCGTVLEAMNRPSDLNLLCLVCDEKEYEHRKQDAERKFQEHYGFIYGSSVASIEPITEELLEFDVAGIEHIAILKDGVIYHITADGPIYVNEVCNAKNYQSDLH
jgi:hypothetical protein